MPLYEVAIIEHPEKKKKLEKLILKPTPIMAKDENAAGMKAVLEHKDLEVDFDRMEVLVRPF